MIALRGQFRHAELAIHREAWSQPHACTSMLNWYRALFRRPPAGPVQHRIDVPALLIWGARDRFLGREMAQPSIDLCSDGRLVFFEEATHWVHHECRRWCSATTVVVYF